MSSSDYGARRSRSCADRSRTAQPLCASVPCAMRESLLCVPHREATMSTAPELRRADRAMTEEEIASFLRGSHHGRLATVGSDGYPYCLPLLYVFLDGRILVHG